MGENNFGKGLMVGPKCNDISSTQRVLWLKSNCPPQAHRVALTVLLCTRPAEPRYSRSHEVLWLFCHRCLRTGAPQSPGTWTRASFGLLLWWNTNHHLEKKKGRGPNKDFFFKDRVSWSIGWPKTASPVYLSSAQIIDVHYHTQFVQC